jgi:hypothetical protein
VGSKHIGWAVHLEELQQLMLIFSDSSVNPPTSLARHVASSLGGSNEDDVRLIQRRLDEFVTEGGRFANL